MMSSTLTCRRCFGTSHSIPVVEYSSTHWWRTRFLPSSLITELSESAVECNGCALLFRMVQATGVHLWNLESARIHSLQVFRPIWMGATLIILHGDRDQAELLCGFDIGQWMPKLPFRIHKANLGLGAGTPWAYPQSFIGFQPASFKTWSARAALATTWINECFSHHEKCRRSPQTPLPRRVIDVGHREAFLFESHGAIGRYATLSHCWEDSQPLKTIKTTLKYRLGQLIWAQLPIAFQECIELVRLLGIRYVWIDSLCIVQDDHDEWEIEAARMASIYENSYLTIAMHQPAPNQSCLNTKKDISISIPFSYQDKTSNVHFTSVKEHSPWLLDNDKMSTRGWCFQASVPLPRTFECH